MPYILQAARNRIHSNDYPNNLPVNSGELNYAITCVIMNYFLSHEQRYATINDVLGALEGAKLEFYRRVVIPYEDIKMKENGDCY